MGSRVYRANRAGFIVPIITVVLVASVAAVSFASPVAWDNATGANARFGWSNGQSGDGGLSGAGLWGDPTVNELGFFFRDMEETFAAEATHPASDNILSGMSVTLNTMTSSPPAAPALTELHIREWGCYTGEIEDVMATSGTVQLIPIVPSSSSVNLGQLTMDYDDVEKTWTASMDIYFDQIGGGFPPALNIFGLDISNHLKAVPLDGRTASIQKLGADIVVPEPACLTLLLVGLGGVLLRRR